ncbi:MAG: diaminopimelate epimerase [bacterium]
MDFVKMHGLGNDFVVLEKTGLEDVSSLSRRLCDRHFGIGADGLVLILPSDRADFRMRIINPDGSEAEMCGNGIRCAAKRFLERGKTYSTEENAVELIVETLAGIRLVRAFRDPAGAFGRIEVNMGEPVLSPEAIPVLIDAERVLDHPLDVDGKRYPATCLSLGNPHCVLFLDEDVGDVDVAAPGRLIESLPIFPNRTNVEFVNVLGKGEIKLRAWERGAGETLACGTGACAAVVAGFLTGRLDEKATARLPGGDLEIVWTKNGAVLMTGPAETVFYGSIPDQSPRASDRTAG